MRAAPYGRGRTFPDALCEPHRSTHHDSPRQWCWTKLFPPSGSNGKRVDMRARFVLVASIGVALLGSCGSALAANIIIGNPQLNTGKYGSGCENEEGCTFFNIELPKSAGLVQSPVDGAIVNWSVKGSRPEAGYAIQVLERRDERLEFTPAGASAPVTPASTNVASFKADLPIHVGDYVGLEVPKGGTVGEANAPGAESGFFNAFKDGLTKTTDEYPSEVAFYAEVQPAPKITQITPVTGPTSGGTVVKIIGSNFEGVTSVKFGTVPATSFNVESEGNLEAIAPPVSSPEFVDVSVTTVAGSSEPTFFFEYTPLPTPPATHPTCVVPRILRNKLAAARQRARRADCAIGRVRKVSGATARTGRVVKQNPKAGKTVPQGTKIAVTLG